MQKIIVCLFLLLMITGCNNVEVTKITGVGEIDLCTEMFGAGNCREVKRYDNYSIFFVENFYVKCDSKIVPSADCTEVMFNG